MRRFDPALLDVASKRLSEAVLDPARWPSVMEDLSAAVGATGALLLQSDVRTDDVPRTPSIDEHVRSYFRGGWHMRDVRAERGVPLLVRGAPVVTDDDILSSDEISANMTYNECFVPNGYPRFTVVGFWAGSALWGLSFQRTLQDVEPGNGERGLLAGMSRRLTEAATLSQAVGRATLSSTTNALDAIQKAAVAIDHTGFVLDANSTAQALFDGNFNLRGGRLSATDPQARAQLAVLVERMRVSSDLEAFHADPIVIRRGHRSPVIIHVLPVHGGARSPFLGARAILTLAPVVRKPSPSEILLSQVFDLTPAEARLAAALAHGVSTTEAAQRLGIAELTARTQLKAVFLKTGTHRQPELVALLASL